MTIMMLFGGMLWSNVVATFCGVIANSDPDATMFHATMDSLNVSHDSAYDLNPKPKNSASMSLMLPRQTEHCCAVAALHGGDEHPKGHADAASGILPSVQAPC